MKEMTAAELTTMAGGIASDLLKQLSDVHADPTASVLALGYVMGLGMASVPEPNLAWLQGKLVGAIVIGLADGTESTLARSKADKRKPTKASVVKAVEDLLKGTAP